jgi:starch phosphorylase
MTGTIYKLEVNPQIPERLARLEELANNLWYSWDSHTRSLFSSLSHPLWQASNHNPKIFLKRADQKKLEAAAENPIFQGALDRVLAAYDSYHERPGMAHVHGHQFKEDDLIAYFCAEFGFHSSLPIYSGGLGILAGDHCKAASDMGLPFIGIGLLYRQGYFQQTLDANGQQQPIYNDSDFDDLPVSPVLDAAGEEVLVKVDFPGRTVQAKVWEARVGHVRLVLLDTWLPQNSEHDREITHRLYGGDKTTRIEQEILLGVGGARALAALGLKPTIWHVNEGHAAFLILERMHSMISKGMPFEAALEAVAANMVFTTHTPVPAGHDHFSAEMIRHYFSGWCYDLGLPWEQLMALGAEPGKPDFNMTALALRGSRHHNGVSRIHGDVSSDICRHLWPQIEPSENPMDYVTNGVHLQTFLAADWFETFERYLGIGWQVRQNEPSSWEGVYRIPDATFWSIRQQLKSQLLHRVRESIRRQHLRNHGSPTHLDRLLKFADPDNPNILTIGFARRFATYKRAPLVFQQFENILKLVHEKHRPVQFVFAGKAHPRDDEGKRFIQQIIHLSKHSELAGHLVFLENYDVHVARQMVAGCDIWLNNPRRPLEASGTSGMKATAHGCLNMSILDGWWREGYDGTNGFAIGPDSHPTDVLEQDRVDSANLYKVLTEEVVPSFFNRDAQGIPRQWIARIRRALTTLAPQYSTWRMVQEYANTYYMPHVK